MSQITYQAHTHMGDQIKSSEDAQLTYNRETWETFEK